MGNEREVERYWDDQHLHIHIIRFFVEAINHSLSRWYSVVRNAIRVLPLKVYINNWRCNILASPRKYCRRDGKYVLPSSNSIANGYKMHACFSLTTVQRECKMCVCLSEQVRKFRSCSVCVPSPDSIADGIQDACQYSRDELASWMQRGRQTIHWKVRMW